MTDDAKKLKATQLRRQGYFYYEIAALLSIPKSTIYGWTKNIQMTQIEAEKYFARIKASKLFQQKDLTRKKNKMRSIDNMKIAFEASSIVTGTVFDTNQLRIMCALLYWCEGGKDVAAGLQFINSDPNLVETFLKLLRASFSLDNSKFRVLLHLHEYHDQEIQKRYWSKVTDIPLRQFYKTYLKPHTGHNLKAGYPGCASIRYHDAKLGKLVKMIYTEFQQEYRGVR